MYVSKHKGRLPHGRRGLKHKQLFYQWAGAAGSPPSREAWIEMANPVICFNLKIVASLTGGVD